MFHLLCPHNNKQRKTSLSNPSLQELAMHLESIDIFAITRPSLQDFPGQKICNNSPLLRKIIRLTNPSLQDFQNDAFTPFLLQEPITFHIFRMLVPVFPPVIVILLHPALLALLLILLIIRIVFHFWCCQRFLLSRWQSSLSQYRWFFTRRIRKKKAPAGSICTSDLLVHGFHPLGKPYLIRAFLMMH